MASTRSGLDHRRAREGQVAIALAAVAWSTAGLAQRQLDATPVTQVAGRAGFAAVALFALVLAGDRILQLPAGSYDARSDQPREVKQGLSTGG